MNQTPVISEGAKQHVIKFVWVERDCTYNTAAREERNGNTLVYDIKVMINGEHRATWIKSYKRQRYALVAALPGHIPICGDDRFHSQVSVTGKPDFLPTIERLLAADLIPTVGMKAEMLKGRKDEEARMQQEDEETARAYRIQEAGPELLAALMVIFEDWKRLKQIECGLAAATDEEALHRMTENPKYQMATRVLDSLATYEAQVKA